MPESLLPKVEKIIEVEPCCCPKCSTPYEMMEATKDSHAIGAKIEFFEIIFKRQVLRKVCNCEGVDKFKVAPAPKRAIPKSKYDDSFLIHLLLLKYEYGMPQNRLIELCKGVSGHKASPGTLCGGTRKLNERLKVIHDEILKELIASDRIHADETSWRMFQMVGEQIDLLMEDLFDEEKKRENNKGNKDTNPEDMDDPEVTRKKWWMWLFLCDSVTYYTVSPGRSANVLERIFKNKGSEPLTISC